MLDVDYIGQNQGKSCVTFLSSLFILLSDILSLLVLAWLFYDLHSICFRIFGLLHNSPFETCLISLDLNQLVINTPWEAKIIISIQALIITTPITRMICDMIKQWFNKINSTLKIILVSYSQARYKYFHFKLGSTKFSINKEVYVKKYEENVTKNIQ